MHLIKFVNIVNLMINLIDPKMQMIIERSLDKGLYVNDDDQDWGSAGMNDIQEDSE